MATSSMANLLDSLDQARVIHYSPQALSAALQQLRTNLDRGSTSQYLVVRGVNETIFNRIDNGYRGVRLTWYSDVETLIIKVPTEAHDQAAASFGGYVDHTARNMGVANIERRVVGTATYHAVLPARTVSKQPDWGMKPQNLRPHGRFPTIVLEVGFSETLTQLRKDARLWFAMSNEVQIVILIAIRAAKNNIIFEKWAMAPTLANQPVTRNAPAQVPQCEQSITITRTPQANNTYTLAITAGMAPLTLEFNKLFLRQPVGGEQDIDFTQADLFDVAQSAFDNC